MMFNSLEKIKALPSETLIYCGHEYTKKLDFCQTIDPENNKILKRIEETMRLMDIGKYTVPLDYL